MSAFQIFGALVSLAVIGFAITVIEHARAVLRDGRGSKHGRVASRIPTAEGSCDRRRD
ncbi:hypothetical protein [Sphingomonas nostoxanthinifaciens]|uniref:hypothetical protein n=1 Tax=Sphingomonas nostoxanthinifaciens TaxID=2872652 RepID=UPI001CC20896|nr:hypothetical protein [Sphingomonas nostoxanthinifaciens]UAK23976.1 hypothetical protein K8P63_16695 [Sphingomonas nostoxanthinifaciens]